MEGDYAPFLKILCAVGSQLTINHYIEETREFPTSFGGNSNNSSFGFFATLGVIVFQDDLLIAEIARDFELKHRLLILFNIIWRQTQQPSSIIPIIPYPPPFVKYL